MHMTEASEGHQGKNPKRVAAGKKAAQKRKQQSKTGSEASTATAFGNPKQLGQQAGEMWLQGFNNTIQSGLKQTLGAFRSSTSQAAGGAQGSSSSGGSQASTG
jgi:hypothetical protein